MQIMVQISMDEGNFLLQAAVHGLTIMNVTLSICYMSISKAHNMPHYFWGLAFHSRLNRLYVFGCPFYWAECRYLVSNLNSISIMDSVIYHYYLWYIV